MAITDKKNKVADGIAPIFIGLTIGAVGMSFGHNCGFSLNPARDFGPRWIITSFLWQNLRKYSEFSLQWSMEVTFSLLTISISGFQLLDHMLEVLLLVFSTNILLRFVNIRCYAPLYRYMGQIIWPSGAEMLKFSYPGTAREKYEVRVLSPTQKSDSSLLK